MVETGNFGDKTEHRFPSSKGLRAVERFTRVAENTIHTSSPSTILLPIRSLGPLCGRCRACSTTRFTNTHVTRGTTQ